MTPLPAAVTLDGFGAPIDGTQVLLMEPNAVTSRPQAHLVRGARVDATSGAGFADKATHQLPNARHEFQFVCETRAELAALRQFFDEMRGRQTAFWFPTWQWEFEIGPLAWGSSIHSLKTSARFGARYFDESLGYRMWAVLRGERAEIYQAIAINPGDIADPPAGYEWVKNGVTQLVNDGLAADGIVTPYTEEKGVRPLWLRYGRFDSDTFDAEVDVNGNGAAVVTLGIVESFDFPVSMLGAPAIMEWDVPDGTVAAGDLMIVHTFDTPGLDAFDVSVAGDGLVEYLLIAAGAGGGAGNVNRGAAGGGGAGGYLGGIGSFASVGVGSHPIRVGFGGGAGSDGGNTTFTTVTPSSVVYTALGGGSHTHNGGCGGGGDGLGGGTPNIAAGTGSQGYNGGSATDQGGGGGGGGGGPGQNAGGGGDIRNGGDGGAGFTTAFDGASTTYCGGGGGGVGKDSSFSGNCCGTPGLGRDGGGNGGRDGGATDATWIGCGGGGEGRTGGFVHGGSGYRGRAQIRYLASTGLVATGGVITTFPA